jgi:hypothetical protein
MRPVSAVDVAWQLYREGAGRSDDAAELAWGIVLDERTPGDDLAKAGTLLFAVGRFDQAERAREAAIAAGASPQLLAYLDTACALREGDGREARRVLAQHLSSVPGPLHPDMPWLAAEIGAPRLAWQASRRAGESRSQSAGWALRAAAHRAPRRACSAVNCTF